jgi:hypothetical protein
MLVAVLVAAGVLVGVLGACTGASQPAEPEVSVDPDHLVTGTPAIVGTITAGEYLVEDLGTITWPDSIANTVTHSGPRFRFIPPEKRNDPSVQRGLSYGLGSFGWEVLPGRLNVTFVGSDGPYGSKALITDDLVGAQVRLCFWLNGDAHFYGYFFPADSDELYGGRRSCTPWHEVMAPAP